MFHIHPVTKFKHGGHSWVLVELNCLSLLQTPPETFLLLSTFVWGQGLGEFMVEQRQHLLPCLGTGLLHL